MWTIGGESLLHLSFSAAKSLQSCLTLCDPIDRSPPGSPVPGILQARTLEWVAISFSNAWKWKVKVKSLNHVRLLATPWTAAHQAPPSTGFSRQEDWSGVPSPCPFNSLHIYNSFHYHTCSSQLYHHFGEINFSAYIIWMMYITAGQYSAVWFSSLSLSLLFIFTANSLSNFPSTVGWEISVKALCCSKLQQLFHRLDPMFSISHVFIILVEYLYQQFPEKGNLGGKTLQTLPSLKQFLLYHRKYSLTIDFKLETISFYNIKDIVPLSSSFHCCCSNVWSYSNPFPFSLPICKIFFVPWFRNFIMHLVKNYFIPWFWTFDMPF